MKTKKTEIARPTLAMIKRGHRVTREEHNKFRHALANTYGRPFSSRMAVQEGMAQAKRGEAILLEKFGKQMRKKYGISR